MSEISKNNLALALDNVNEISDIELLVDQTLDSIGVYKIGFEQFIRFGPSVVKSVQDKGVQIFLDMKLHDIPNTVAKAVTSAAEHNVEYLTIHTMGGTAMMKAAVEAASKCDNPPKILGVTILTSIDQEALNNDLKVDGVLTDQVKHLAKLAVDSGLDGIVCSAADLSEVKPILPDNFEVITPGIRPAGTDAGDQKRVATPKDAIDNGATLLVLGRAVTAADSAKDAAASILESIA